MNSLNRSNNMATLFRAEETPPAIVSQQTNSSSSFSFQPSPSPSQSINFQSPVSQQTNPSNSTPSGFSFQSSPSQSSISFQSTPNLFQRATNTSNPFQQSTPNLFSNASNPFQQSTPNLSFPSSNTQSPSTLQTSFLSSWNCKPSSTSTSTPSPQTFTFQPLNNGMFPGSQSKQSPSSSNQFSKKREPQQANLINSFDCYEVQFDLPSLGLQIIEAPNKTMMKVTEVVPGSVAHEKGVTVGDYVIEVNGHGFENLKSFRAKLTDQRPVTIKFRKDTLAKGFNFSSTSSNNNTSFKLDSNPTFSPSLVNPFGSPNKDSIDLSSMTLKDSTELIYDADDDDKFINFEGDHSSIKTNIQSFKESKKNSGQNCDIFLQVYDFSGKDEPSSKENWKSCSLNNAGFKIKLGTKNDGLKKFYCGRLLGKTLIPGSDGMCGPNNGPQCSDCLLSQDKMDPSIADLLVGDEDEDLLCPICLQTFTNPVCCSDGHTFCDACIKAVLKTTRYCPMDRKEITLKDLKANEEVKKKVKASLVQCKTNLTSDGKNFCCWVGSVDGLEEHLQSECQYITVMCNSLDCNKILPRYQMVEHAKECENRLIKCKLCSKVGPYLNRKIHKNKCSNWILKCPNEGCEVEHERQKLILHRTECKFEVLSCPYKKYGCNSKCTGQLLRSEYDEHVKNTDNMLAAVPSLFLTVNQLQIELNELKKEKGKFSGNPRR